MYGNVIFIIKNPKEMKIYPYLVTSKIEYEKNALIQYKPTTSTIIMGQLCKCTILYGN